MVGLLRFRLLFVILFCCFQQDSAAQCANLINTVSYSDTVCSGSQINPTVSNGINTQWDFCPGDLKTAPQKTTFSNPSAALSNSQGFTLVQDGDSIYGFVFNRGNDHLIRIDFGTEITDNFVITDLQNPFSLLAYGIHKPEFIQENGVWFGFFPSSTNQVFVIEFGAGLSEEPTASYTIADATFNGVRGIEVLVDAGITNLIVTNTNNGTLSIIKFSNGIANSPDAAVVVDKLNGTDNSALPWDIAFYKYCDRWVGFTVTQASELIRLDFGNSLLNSPVRTNFGNQSMIIAGAGLDIINEGGSYYVLVQNVYLRVIKIDFGSDLLANPISADNTVLSDIGDAVGLDAFLHNSRTYIFTIGSNSFTKLTFSSACNSSQPMFMSNFPAPYFNDFGWKKFALTIGNSNNDKISVLDSIYLSPAPGADFKVNTSIACEGYPISFQNLSTGINLSYSWLFGDGNSSTDADPMNIFSVKGSYPVELSVGWAENSCVTKKQLTLSVEESPLANFSVQNDVCAGSPVSFSDNSTFQSESINKWEWINEIGTFSTIGDTSFVFSQGGTKQAELVVTNIKGCADTVSQTFMVKNKPVPQFQIINSCANENILFQNNSTIPAPDVLNSFVWNFGDGNSSTQQSPLHPYISSGNFQAKLTVSAANGCADSIIKTVSVVNKPVANFTFIKDTVCPKEILQITDLSTYSGDTINAWTWAVSNGDIFTGQEPMISLAGSGTYTIALTVNAGSSCDSTFTRGIIVSDPPKIGFSSADGCQGQAISFNDLSSPGSADDPINFWSWTFPDGIVNQQNVTKTFSDSGIVTVNFQVKSLKNCTADTQFVQQTFPNPKANFFNYNPCEDASTIFTNSSDSFGYAFSSIKWTGLDGNILVGQTFGTPGKLSFPDAKSYNVMLTVETDKGCLDSITKTLFVNPKPIAQVKTTGACEDKKVVFTDASILPNVQWKLNSYWDLGDGTKVQQNYPSFQPVNHIYPDTGLYQIVYAVQSSNGCRDTVKTTLRIYPQPEVSFTTSGKCEKDSISLINTSSQSGLTWSWTVGTVKSTLKDPKVYFNSAGSYNIQLVGMNAGNCSDTAKSVLTIHQLPIAQFTLADSYGNPPFVPEITNTSTGANSFIWNFGNGDTSVGFEPNYTFNDTGKFEIKLTAISSEGCRDSSVSSISVIQKVVDLSIIGFTAQKKDGYLVVTVEFINKGTADITSFDLYTRLSNGNSTKEEWKGKLKKNGYMAYKFPASMQVTSDEMYICLTADNVNQEIDANPLDNQICRSLSDALFIVHHVYPNPSKDRLTLPVAVPVEGDLTFEIFDVQGNLLQRSIRAGTKGINFYQSDLSAFPNGLYGVRVSYQNFTEFIKVLKN